MNNEEKLEKMCGVVEEKLDKTLNERLKLSFESVSKNLGKRSKGTWGNANTGYRCWRIEKKPLLMLKREVFWEKSN